MAINGVGHNYDYLGTTTNYIRGKATVRAAISKMVKQSANLSISDAGRNMLREMASKFEPDSEYPNVRELTIQNTNEVAWEHYTAMRDISSLTLKDGNYNVEDVMKSIMDTYETRYNEIVKEHDIFQRTVIKQKIPVDPACCRSSGFSNHPAFFHQLCLFSRFQ